MWLPLIVSRLNVNLYVPSASTVVLWRAHDAHKLQHRVHFKQLRYPLKKAEEKGEEEEEEDNNNNAEERRGGK